MAKVLEAFSNDTTTYSHAVVHRRVGIAKTLIEEYQPLLLLARHLNAAGAHLMPESHEGPDGVVFPDGSQSTVQITAAGENYSAALQREVMSTGRAIFPNRHARRDRQTCEIVETGRASTTREANTAAAVDEIVSAIRAKIRAYREGTELLLVATRRSAIAMTADWRERLDASVLALDISPYRNVYVADSKTCLLCR